MSDPLLQRYRIAINDYADARSQWGAIAQSEDEPTLYQDAVRAAEEDASEYVRGVAAAYLNALDVALGSAASMHGHLAAVKGY
jgi:hypothetical protein